MNTPGGWPARLYAVMLRLYPTRFRAEFADEMRAVFVARLADAGRDPAAGARLLLAELLATPVALSAAYRLRSSRPILPPRWPRRLFDRLLGTPTTLLAPDGRNSRRQLFYELLPFLLAALALVGGGYLPLYLSTVGQPWPPPGLVTAARALPWLGLAAGLARGMPRWGYPWAGLALGAVMSTALETRSLPTLAFLLVGGALAALLTWAAFRPAPTDPGWLRQAVRGLRADPSRAAFGFYGLLPLAVGLGFDDGYLDFSTPFLALAATVMLVGALGFIRARGSEAQAADLLGGLTGALGMALLDAAAHAYLVASGPWIGWLWVCLAVLIAAPFLLPLATRRAVEPAK